MRCIMYAAIIPALAFTATAQTVDPEKSKVELSGSIWRVDTSGKLQASDTALDLKTDLGITQQKLTYGGKLVVKPSRRNKLIIEGAPFRLDGTQTLSRTITYQGQTYQLNDKITSKASLDSVYGGYQFDVISNPAGHLGFQAGGAYLNATGSITSGTTGVTASKSVTVGLPLAGVEFRVFPVRRKALFEVNGEAKGMALGSYGHFVQVTGNAGLGWGPVLFEAGYRIADYDLHTTNSSTVVAPRFMGPVFSIVLRLP